MVWLSIIKDCYLIQQNFIAKKYLLIISCVKVYKVVSYKNSDRESESLKLCCINIHLTDNPFTFNKYFNCIVHECYTLPE